MIGTFRWNLISGLLGLVLTFLFSIGNNVFLTSFIRSLYSFVIFFVLCFAFRWLLGTVAGLKQVIPLDLDDLGGNAVAGLNVDAVTPGEEESLHQLLKENMEAPIEQQFTPLKPPKLTTNTNLSPEELAKVVRHISEQE